MPKVIDKAKRKEDIAQKSLSLLLEKGFCNWTVSEVAKKAKIAKGSIYNYFDSKEDIVFEIIKSEYKRYDIEVQEKINNSKNIEEKVLAIFELCLSDSEQNKNRRKIYREFVSICLNHPSDKMISFKKDIKIKYIKWLEEILTQAVQENLLKQTAPNFAEGLFVLGEGVLLLSSYNANILKNFTTNLLNELKIQNEEKIWKEV